MTQQEEAQQAGAELAEYLRQHQSRLYGYIHSLVRDFDDTDDLFQQTALVLWQKFAEFHRGGNFFAWACGVARLEVANFLRRRGRQRLYFGDELSLQLVQAHEELSEEELEGRREALAGCVEKLRQRDRELLTECYGEEIDVPGVAGRHGRSPQSVYNSLRRIRRALFACIGQRLAQQARPGWDA